MKAKFEKVLERDVDFLVIDRFLNDQNFKKIFLNQIGIKKQYEVTNIEHSLADENGESDITVILQNNSKKIGLLIEDKIDAVAMPNQRERYNLRGEKGIKNGEYSRFFVFIIAPKDYLYVNEEAKKYENQISYEQLLEYFKGDTFASGLLTQAILEKKNGYIVVENKNVTEFWQRYYKNIREKYPILKINEVKGPRGDSAVWPEIKTPIAKINIIHKSDKGFLDLTFPKMGEHIDIFKKYVDDFLSDDMMIEKTNKSAAIRIIVPKIDFKSNFDNYSSEIEKIMEDAIRLCSLVLSIDLKNMYNKIAQEKRGTFDL